MFIVSIFTSWFTSVIDFLFKRVCKNRNVNKTERKYAARILFVNIHACYYVANRFVIYVFARRQEDYVDDLIGKENLVGDIILG